jgi:hypothetical protein
MIGKTMKIREKVIIVGGSSARRSGHSKRNFGPRCRIVVIVGMNFLLPRAFRTRA